MGLKTSMGGGLMPFDGQTATMSDVAWRLAACHHTMEAWEHGGGLMPFAGQTATMSDVSRMSAYHNQLGWV